MTSSGSKKSDPAWEHGVQVNPTDRLKIQCKYCGVTRAGGVFRLKHHLAGTRQNVEPCPRVPEGVRVFFLDLLRIHVEESQRKKDALHDIGAFQHLSEEDVLMHGERTKGKNPMEDLTRVGSGTETQRGVRAPNRSQKTINAIFRKGDRRKVNEAIARWFYANAIPFNTIKSVYFKPMYDAIASSGMGLDPPSYHEIREPLLMSEVANTKRLIEEFKMDWRRK